MKDHLPLLRHDKPLERPLKNISLVAFEAETGIKAQEDDLLILLEDDIAGYCEDTAFLVRKADQAGLSDKALVVSIKHDEALPGKLKDVDDAQVIGSIIWSGMLKSASKRSYHLDL